MIVESNPPPSPLPNTASPEKIGASEKIEASSDGVDLISDAALWPSLTEATRPSPKSSSSPVTESPVSSSEAPAVLNSLPNPNTNSTPNPNTIFSPHPNRQRQTGRGGSSRGGPSRGGFIRHPPPPQQLPSPPPLPFYGGFEGPIRGPFFIDNGYGLHPRPSDHNFRRPRSPHRGGGRHYNRVGFQGPDWNAVRFPQPGPPMGYPMPPQQMVPFPFMHVLPPEPFMGMHPYAGGHGPVPPPSLSPPPQHPVELDARLRNQINYYFSDENLIKDMYLRSQMDNDGWVSVSLIANFKKVRELTQDIHFILEVLRASTIVEVQGDKIRRRNDWRRWITTSS